jgi:hypothetical protein
VERVHQTLGNMICIYELENFDFDYNDPWSQISANCAWALRFIAHSILDATPAQIVFGRDMFLDLSFTTNYSELKNKKQKASDLNVDRESTKRIKYDYKVNDLILLHRGTLQGKLFPKRDGLYQVIRVYSNGTLEIRKVFMYNKCQ